MTTKQRIQMALSYLRVLAATGTVAVLQAFLTGNHDAYELATAGLIAIAAAILPPLMRYVNPNDKVFGRGSTPN